MESLKSNQCTGKTNNFDTKTIFLFVELLWMASGIQRDIQAEKNDFFFTFQTFLSTMNNKWFYSLYHNTYYKSIIILIYNWLTTKTKILQTIIKKKLNKLIRRHRKIYSKHCRYPYPPAPLQAVNLANTWKWGRRFISNHLDSLKRNINKKKNEVTL